MDHGPSSHMHLLPPTTTPIPTTHTTLLVPHSGKHTGAAPPPPITHTRQLAMKPEGARFRLSTASSA